MTAAELIKKLQELPPTDPVFVKDEFGFLVEIRGCVAHEQPELENLSGRHQTFTKQSGVLLS